MISTILVFTPLSNDVKASLVEGGPLAVYVEEVCGKANSVLFVLLISSS